MNSSPVLSEYPRSRGFIAVAVVTMLYVGIYLRDVLRSLVSEWIPPIALAVGVTVGVIQILLRSFQGGWANRVGRFPSYALLAAFACWAAAVANTHGLALASYMASVLFAFIIYHTAPRHFIALLVVHCVVSLLIQAWELGSGSYLFTISDQEGLELSNELFAGAQGVNRTKGLFAGPLSAVAFSYWIAFLFRRSLWSALALILCAYMASGRLGMMAGSIILLWRFGAGQARLGGLLAAVAIALLVAFLVVGDSTRVDFFKLAFDPDSPGNAGRFLFWASALAEYLNYGALDSVIGHFNYIGDTDIYPENDFLQLLLDHGVVGFAIYVAALGRIISLAKRRGDMEGVLVGFLLIAIMNLFPMAHSLFSATLFWLYIFSYENHTSEIGARHPPLAARPLVSEH